MGLEIEIKLVPARESVEKSLVRLLGEPRLILMDTVYYDTPDGRLTAGKMMLRRRSENGDTVWCLKAPAENGRLELETKAKDLDEAAAFFEKNIPLPRPLSPVAGARFERRAFDHRENGLEAEIAVDRGEVYCGERREEISEVELELVSGSEKSLRELARDLAEEHGLKPCGLSKSQRAIKLYREANMKRSVDPFFIANELLNYCIKEGMVGFELTEDKQVLYTVTDEGERRLRERFGVDLTKPCANVKQI